MRCGKCYKILDFIGYKATIIETGTMFEMDKHLKEKVKEDVDYDYDPMKREWNITRYFCPHCGAKLTNKNICK